MDVLPWSGAAKWAAAKEEAWEVQGEEAGSVTAVGPLSFVKVFKAGHMVREGESVLCCGQRMVQQQRLVGGTAQPMQCTHSEVLAAPAHSPTNRCPWIRAATAWP